jgi:alanyl-tRNA synthetase
VTRLLYHDDPYLLEFDADVTARREHEGRPAVVLDRTAFFAESGGQPCDTGSLSGVPVLAVLHQRDEVLHVLGGPLQAERVHGRVDAERRRDHRQQHHGQHLLSRAFVELAQARTTSFHLGAAESTIDLDRDVGEAAARAAEARTNEVVWEARPVRVRTVDRREAGALGVHAPAEAGDAIRLVEAEGFDLQPCGGTHPRSTSEVGVVLLLGRERYKGGARIRFVCGHRALRAAQDRLALVERLGALLSVPPEGLVDAAQRALDQLEESSRRSRALLERALEAEARRLHAASSSTPALIVASYDGWAPAELRALAQQVVALAPAVALLASRADKAYLAFAQSPGLGHDVPALLARAAGALGGRGGGRGDLAQGGGERLDLVGEVLESAAADVRRRRPG